MALLLVATQTPSCTALAHNTAPPSPSAANDYPKLRHKPTSLFINAILHSNPLTAKRAFYGNYGGPGNRGGQPKDLMDELFRRHDLVYSRARSWRSLAAADRGLVAALKKLDPTQLSEKGRAYRNRAIAFFSSAAARVAGKPLFSLIRTLGHRPSQKQAESAIVHFMLAPVTAATGTSTGHRPLDSALPHRTDFPAW